MMYYYRRKTSPWKWILIILILAVVGALGWWFYVNYFSKIEINKPVVEPTPQATVESVKTLNASLAMINGDVRLTQSGQTESAPAILDAVLHQGDKIEIGSEGYAVLKNRKWRHCPFGREFSGYLAGFVRKKYYT